MRGYTHILFGLTTLAAVQTVAPFIEPHPVSGLPAGLIWGVAAAILGALTPDIDAEDSTIKRELGMAGGAASLGLRLFGVKHRGLTHYEITTALVILAAWLLGRQVGYADAGLAFGLGYLSHFLADALTKTGVPLWLVKGRLHLLPRLLRVQTGGPAEMLVTLAVSFALVWLLPDLVPAEWLKLLKR